MSDVQSADASPQDSIGRFHQELKAAALARVPLELGGIDSTYARMRGSLRNLNWLEGVIAQRLAGGQTLTQLLGSDTNDLPNRYRAAFRVFDKTGATGLVLDGLATGLRSRRQLARVLRSTLAYLILVLFIAAVLISFFSMFIVPSIEVMRDDLRLSPAIDAPFQQGITRLLPMFAMILQIIAFVLLLLLLVGASSKITSWLGGRRFQTQAAAATALRATRALVSNDVPMQEAISIGCALVGNDPAVRKHVDAAIDDRNLNANNAEQLDSLADHFQAAALNRLTVLKVALPVTLVAVIGGATVMTYSLAIFWPVIELLRELSLPGS